MRASVSRSPPASRSRVRGPSGQTRCRGNVRIAGAVRRARGFAAPGPRRSHRSPCSLTLAATVMSGSRGRFPAELQGSAGTGNRPAIRKPCSTFASAMRGSANLRLRRSPSPAVARADRDEHLRKNERVAISCSPSASRWCTSAFFGPGAMLRQRSHHRRCAPRSRTCRARPLRSHRSPCSLTLAATMLGVALTRIRLWQRLRQRPTSPNAMPHPGSNRRIGNGSEAATGSQTPVTMQTRRHSLAAWRRRFAPRSRPRDVQPPASPVDALADARADRTERLQRSVRVAILRPLPASRWRASAVDGADGNGPNVGAKFRALAPTVAMATAPGPCRHRRHRRPHKRAGHRPQLAAERRAPPTPPVPPLAQALADTTVRTCADAAAASVGREDSAARSRAVPEAARLILMDPPVVPDFRPRPACIARVSVVHRTCIARVSPALRRNARGTGRPARAPSKESRSARQCRHRLAARASACQTRATSR